MRRIAAALVLVALAATPARGEGLLDRPAPDPVVAKWIQGDPPPAWKALKGRCALVEILDPDDLVSQGLVSRTAEIAAKAEARRLVLFSVATGTGAEEGRAKEFAKSFKVGWTLGLDRNRETWAAFGLPNLPFYALVTPDGRVAWEGSPGALSDRTLDSFCERARLWRPEEVAKPLRPAAEAFVRGKYALAARKAEEALADVRHRVERKLPVEGTEEKDGTVILEAIRDVATTRLGIADGLAKDRWSLDARDLLEGVAAAFAGLEYEGRAKERLAAIADDDRAQFEILAMKKLRDILGKIRPVTRHTVQHAIEGIDNLLDQFGNLQTGDRARAEKKRLEKLLEAL